MENIDLTVEGIALLGGFLTTIIFSYFPVVRVWFAGKDSEVKSYIMLGTLLTIEAAIAAAMFYGLIPSVEGLTWGRLISITVALLVANQPTHDILPELNDVKMAKASRTA